MSIANGPAMLRVSTISEGDATTIKLEGKLLAPWCEEVARACREAAAGEGKQVKLDLDEVTFIDAAGIELVRLLRRQGVAIARCSSFVAELLQMERV
ncbi:MAG: STAS domain-containing protein [Tepidisphaeraceae bacterium]